ncbi:MAG: NAD(P)/FAD-dependent oxidoreductase [Bacteroidetes bacterium]|nr:MAG: NAD(P)/FAD-dependent oxidoreductase [Bacteroidota bacterium]
MKNEFEVLIIGGSYAGLSAAMALGRSMRQVLVMDSGKPCNRFTPHSHNFITHDGEAPAKIVRKARRQVERYDTVHFYEGLAVEGMKNETGFEVKTQSGEVFFGKKIIFATGIRDLLPDIPGLAECWGKTIIHCPYCHGYEFRGQKTGIWANGQRAFHLATLVKNLTDDLTLLTSGKADFDETQLAKLNKHGIEIIETEIAKIELDGGKIESVIFKHGGKSAFQALYAAVPFAQHSDIPASLGCELTEHGYLRVDPFQQTTVEGVFACGDNSSMMRSLANAVATGNLVGAVVNGKLSEEFFTK